MASMWYQLAKWMGLSEDSYRDSYVGFKEAMGLPPAWYAHNKIVGDFGQLPIDVKRRVGEGAVNDLKHDGYRLLREQPNMMQAPSVFKEQICSHAIMYGNGRAAIIRSGDRAVELIPMMPDRTRTLIINGEKWHITKPDKEDNKNLFDVLETDKDGMLVFRDADVLHITGFAFNGIEGIGLLQIAQNVFSTGTQSQRFLDNQLRKGFRGKLFLEAPPGSFRNEAQAKEFIENFNKAEAGADNAGKAGLLREGVKANAVNMSNNDAQFVELQKFNRQDIGMLFGLEGMPGDGESVSYNSLEQKNLAYLQALDKWLVKMEEQCDIKLRSTTEKKNGGKVYFKFNRAALYRTDLSTTMAAFSSAITSRIMNPNECRSKLDLNPYEGGDEFINPAISLPTGEQSPGEMESDPADTQEDAQEDSAQEQTSETTAMNNKAVEETLRSLIQREANNAANAAKKPHFVAWINKNYAKWEPKLAEKVEAIGLDRDLARTHCEESVAILVQIATETPPEKLEETVKNTVKTWQNRVFSFQGVE